MRHALTIVIVLVAAMAASTTGMRSGQRRNPMNLHAMRVEQEIHVPRGPQEILVRPDNQIAYVSFDQSKQVAAIDLSSGKVAKRIDVGAGADGLGWAAT